MSLSCAVNFPISDFFEAAIVNKSSTENFARKFTSTKVHRKTKLQGNIFSVSPRVALRAGRTKSCKAESFQQGEIFSVSPRAALQAGRTKGT